MKRRKDRKREKEEEGDVRNVIASIQRLLTEVFTEPLPHI